MVAYASVEPNVVTTQIPIETMRAIAILLLVSYHVIGNDGSAGLAVAYPDMLRLFADFFIDLRMPFFAFIAGYLYVTRAPTVSQYFGFVRGKLRRLYLPCVIASLLFALAAQLVQNRFALTLDQLWRVPFTSYAHFWFLQSILVIFACFGLVDALLKQRFSAVLLLASIIMYLSPVSPVAFGSSVMSVNGALYLLPYFLLGVVVNRCGAQLWADAGRISLLLVVIAVACALWNVKVLYETGSFSLDRRDVQSVGFGQSICVLVFVSAPRMPLLEKLSPYGFTIYLYHIFGTVAARTFCEHLGIATMEVRFVLGLVGGLALPIMLHEALNYLPRAQQIALGRRTARQIRQLPLRI